MKRRQGLDTYGFPYNIPLEFSPVVVHKDEGPGVCSDFLASIKPILRLSQFIGISPIVFKEIKTVTKVSPIGSASSTDKLSTSSIITPNSGTLDFAPYGCSRFTAFVPWISLPSFSNCLMTAHLLWITIWVLLKITSILQAAFSGTDLYAFSIQVQIYFIQSSCLLLHCLLKRRHLAALWNSLHQVFQGLNSFFPPGVILLDHNDFCSESRTILVHPSLRRLKLISRTLVFIIFCFFLMYSTYFLYTAINVCFINPPPLFAATDTNVNTTRPRYHCPLTYPVLLIEKLTYTCLGIYHQTITALFCSFCFILSFLFKELVARLESVLNTTTLPDGNRDLCIEKLRILYGKLNDCTSLVSSYFGIPILGACITSLVSITAAIYIMLIRTSDLSYTLNSEQVVKFTVLWGFHGIIGTITILSTLNCAQYVKRSGNEIFKILGSGSHKHLSDSDKYEVGVFLHMKRTPGIAACNITPIGMSFIAAAATNVTTYILVLLQFRLGVDSNNNSNNQ